jgi:hypothetical protein
MSNILIQLIPEIIFIFLGILTGTMVTIDWKKDKNKMNLYLIMAISFIFSLSILNILLFLEIDIIQGIIDIILLRQISSIIYIGIFLVFLFYLKGFKRYYTLPLVVSFFLILALLINSDGSMVLIYTIITSVIMIGFFLFDGIKNKNGTVFTLGFFIMFYSISFLIYPFYIAQIILKIIAIFVLLVGVSGFINRYLLVDKKEQEKLKNIWIARMIRKTED